MVSEVVDLRRVYLHRGEEGSESLLQLSVLLGSEELETAQAALAWEGDIFF